MSRLRVITAARFSPEPIGRHLECAHASARVLFKQNEMPGETIVTMMALYDDSRPSKLTFLGRVGRHLLAPMLQRPCVLLSIRPRLPSRHSTKRWWEQRGRN